MSRPDDEAVEAYRTLRTNLQFLRLDKPISVIQLTSSIAGEGKTTTSANLAIVLARAGHRVALIDADLRRFRIHEVFGIGQTPGFTDLLFGAAAKDAVTHVVLDPGTQLSVFPSGAVPSNPGEILSSERMKRLLAEMGAHYDFVIIDSAPILPVSDSVALSGAVDGVIVVAQAGRATDDDVGATIERLERVSAPILGMVLNQASTKSDTEYTYGGYQRMQPSDESTEGIDRPNVDDVAVLAEQARFDVDDPPSLPFQPPASDSEPRVRPGERRSTPRR